MTAVHRTAAFLMIAIEAAIVERALFVFEPYLALLAVLALFGTPGLVRIALGRRGQVGVAVGIGAFLYFAVGVLIARERLPVLPMGQSIHAVAWYLLTLQAMLMFLRQPDGRLPVYFPALGVAVLAYGGANGRHGAADPVFHAAALGFVLLIVVFWGAGGHVARADAEHAERGRNRLVRDGLLLQGGILAAGMLMAFTISTVVGTYRTNIDNAVFGFFGVFADTSAVGFSPDAMLNSVTRLRYSAGQQVALRVKSDTPPGYMRGKAYDKFAGNRWESTPEEELAPAIKDDAGAPAGEGAVRYYQVGPAEQPMRWLDVAIAVRASGYLFAPLERASIAVAGFAPAQDANGNLTAAELPSGVLYRVVCSGRVVPQPLRAAMRWRWTAPPADVDPRIRALADELFANVTTARAKMDAVVGFFAAHFKYNMGIEVPRGEEPLPYFLFTRRQGHCEYFATAAAILLRLGGVPTRYVNGFVTSERNAIGGYWVARNKDAHAWVEAYDDEAGAWVTLEPTVADGLPGEDAAEAGWVMGVIDYVKFAVLRLRNAIVSGVWLARLRASLAAGWPVVLAGGILAGAGAAGLRLWRRRRRVSRQVTRRLPPETVALVRLRIAMDRRVRKWGYTRRDEETVHAFAVRLLGNGPDGAHAAAIQHAAAWYAEYGRVRFGGRITPESVEALKRGLDGI